MNNKGLLPYVYNMASGFLPLVITILLCELIEQDLAFCIGVGVGVVSIGLAYCRKGTYLPNFISFIVTGILVIFWIATLIPSLHISYYKLPFVLEITTLAMLVVFKIYRKSLIKLFREEAGSRTRMYRKSVTAACVAANISISLGILHLLVVFIASFFITPPSIGAFIVYHALPPIVFVLTFVLNQMALHEFNSYMGITEYVPIVNLQGDVIGKCLTNEAVAFKNKFINPVVRIAISVNGMLLLVNEGETHTGEVDFPLRGYVFYKETLEQCVGRLICSEFTDPEKIKPEFSIIHHFENKTCNQLVYLYIVELKDDSLLEPDYASHFKLWTLKQIEENLGEGFFSECFENEYEHLREVICTREKYKES